jgi:hypothetical protein
MRDLLTCEWPRIIPAINRGTEPTTAVGPTDTYALVAEMMWRTSILYLLL